MKLEIGKTYIDRDGGHHKISSVENGWALSGNSWCVETGKYSPRNGDCRLDLIAEVPQKTLSEIVMPVCPPSSRVMLIGTLPELNVQPGDVVEIDADRMCGMIENGATWTITSVEGGKYRGKHPLDCSDVPLSTRHIFKLISRPPPKMWKDMSEDEQGALALAKFVHEKKIQIFNLTWHEFTGSRFLDHSTYRIEPEPEVIEATAGEHVRLTLNRAFELAVKEKRTVTAIHNNRHIEISVKEVK